MNGINCPIKNDTPFEKGITDLSKSALILSIQLKLPELEIMGFIQLIVYTLLVVLEM